MAQGTPLKYKDCGGTPIKVEKLRDWIEGNL